MNTVQKTLIALACGSVLSASAQAAYFYDEPYPYVGVKLGQFMLNEEGFDDVTAYGAYAGYQINSRWGVEADYVNSKGSELSDRGKELIGVPEGSNTEYRVKTISAAGTYRHEFPYSDVYAKGKLGVANTQTLIDGGPEDAGDLAIDETNALVGVGVGYIVSPKFDIEGEYATLIGGDDIALLTLAAKFKF